ncbi:MAG: MFS transporter [Candidatus Dormibacteraeota bacterium]|nr:MFS transporter [Candidatus Dormibacteraeota bacterium]
MRRGLNLLALFLLIEVLDEVVFGAREAAWPVIRRDLELSYAEVGLLLSLPGLAAAVFEPGLGLLADTGRRRLLVVAGGVAFAAGLLIAAAATGFAWLLAGFVVLWPASGAFVSLSQAALMDLDRDRQERNMARWTLAGSVGAVAGPLLIGAAVAAHWSWRAVFLGLAALTLPLAAAAFRAPAAPAVHDSFRAALRGLLRALRRWGVLRWLLVVEVTNLMGDVLLGYLALYFVDVAGLSAAEAAGVVVVWTLAGLAGDALLLLLLRRISGHRFLQVSAVIALAVYPAFLLTPGPAAKVALLAVLGLVHAGWYAIPQGRLFAELGDQSGTAVAMSSLSSAAGSLLPLIVGALAARAGLGAAFWVLLAAPLALLLFAGRRPG